MPKNKVPAGVKNFEVGHKSPQREAGGLAGNDACCFDIDSPDADSEIYMAARLQEVCGNAAKG